MTVLRFWDRGYDVIAEAWSAAAKPGYGVRVCYSWGADGISWAQGATGVCNCDLPLTMDELAEAIKRSGKITDLRERQSEPPR